jgi:FixJ family two-component response regulator
MTPHIAPRISSQRGVRPAESTAPGVTVSIVDIDDRVRLALSGVLAFSGLELRNHACLTDFLDSRCADRPGCLVIDAQMLRANPLPPAVRCPIVVIACEADFAVVVSAMKAGAVDVVEKPPCERKLAAAVIEAIEIDRQRRLVETQHAVVHARFSTLTPRERQVMDLVTAGMMNKLVAADLGLSEITVKAHRGSAMRKMGARSLAELVRMADVIGKARLSPLKNDSSIRARIGAYAHPHSGCSLVQNR